MSLLAAFRKIDVRLRLAALGGAISLATFAACGGCRGAKGPAATAAASASAEARSTSPSDAGEPTDERPTALLWASAKDGDEEDRMALATREGALGLVEAAADPARRRAALQAMGFAAGWAQLPFLADVAGGKSDEEARAALDATLSLAARPRRAEDPEDAVELKDGCAALDGLARDTTRPRERRVAAIRALRMMPCPPTKEDLPVDVDSK